MRVTIESGKTFAEDLKAAIPQGIGALTRTRTIRTRVMLQPERVTGKSGDRIFGAERLRPRADGFRLRRVFTFTGGAR